MTTVMLETADNQYIFTILSDTEASVYAIGNPLLIGVVEERVLDNTELDPLTAIMPPVHTKSHSVTVYVMVGH